MITKIQAPAVLASTAFLLLRNLLSERIWGCHGVNTLAVESPRPSHMCRIEHAENASLPSKLVAKGSPHEFRTRTAHSYAGSETLKGVAILGDSLSDEYRFYAPDRVTARNWVEILAETRGFHFGEPINVASRGASRCRPFGYNWSQSGATTTSLIESGQHFGLEAQVLGGEPISLAAMTIGSNDFADVLLTMRTVNAMGMVLEKATSNLSIILDHLLRVTSTLKLAVFTAVDLLACPLLKGAREAGLISCALADAYQKAVASYNENLHKFIAKHRHRIAIVDINQLLHEIVTARPCVVGDLELDWINPGNQARNLFLLDGFHPGTVGQCLIANRFLAAINSEFGAAIPALDDQEILRVASSVSKPSVSNLIGTGILAAFGYGRRRPRAA